MRPEEEGEQEQVLAHIQEDEPREAQLEEQEEELLEDDQDLYGDQYESQDEYSLVRDEEPYEDNGADQEQQDEASDQERIGTIRLESPVEYLGAISTKPTYDPANDPYRSRYKNRNGEEPSADQPEARQCLATYMNINGIDAYVMFDSGSTSNLMNPDFAQVIKADTFNLKQTIPIQLGCVGSRSAINKGCNVRIRLGPVKVDQMYFHIANIDRYDAILGITFMHSHDIALWPRKRSIFIGGTTGHKLAAITPEEEKSLLNDRHNKARGHLKMVKHSPKSQ